MQREPEVFISMSIKSYRLAPLRANNAINTDNKKRRAFVAPLFIAGYGERWAARRRNLEETEC
jgi:hypothetical protein